MIKKKRLFKIKLKSFYDGPITFFYPNEIVIPKGFSVLVSKTHPGSMLVISTRTRKNIEKRINLSRKARAKARA